MEFITPEQALAKYEENQKACVVERREELLKEFTLSSPLIPYREAFLSFIDDGDLQYVRSQLALARIWNNLPESIEFEKNCQVTVHCRYANVAFGVRECTKEESLSPILAGLFESACKRRVEMLAATEKDWENQVQLYLDNPYQPHRVFSVTNAFEHSNRDWAGISAISVAERYAARKFTVEYKVVVIGRPEDLATEQYINEFTIVLKA